MAMAVDTRNNFILVTTQTCVELFIWSPWESFGFGCRIYSEDGAFPEAKLMLFPRWILILYLPGLRQVYDHYGEPEQWGIPADEKVWYGWDDAFNHPGLEDEAIVVGQFLENLNF